MWFRNESFSLAEVSLYYHKYLYMSLQLDTNSHTVHKTTHRLLRTTATTPSAEHHLQQYTTFTPENGHLDARKHVEIFMIINHCCCIKLVPLVIFICIILFFYWFSWFYFICVLIFCIFFSRRYCYCRLFRLFRLRLCSQNKLCVIYQIFYIGCLFCLTNIFRRCLSAGLSYELRPLCQPHTPRGGISVWK